MFDFRYKKHNYIYNNLVELSRNKYFYKELNLEDKLENRVVLIFAHLTIILKLIKKQNNDINLSQELYDNIFLNLENNIREMGHGDVTVNKKMKDLNKIFHEILLKFIDVINILGNPHTKSINDDNIWFYFDRKMISNSIINLKKNKLLENNVLVIGFDNRGIVDNKKFFTKKDMKRMTYVDKTTANPVSNQSFVTKFLQSVKQKMYGKRKF